MRGDEFLDKMDLIDPEYVLEAEAKGKRRVWQICAAAACLCVIAGVALLALFRQGDPQLSDIPLSEASTATVYFGCDAEAVARSSHDLLWYFTEEKMFSRENMYIFRGRIAGLTNITVDFNGEKAFRCLASISVNEVYGGDIAPGEQITILLPCAVDVVGLYTEDSGVISHIGKAEEGIFMANVYSETSVWEQNGATLRLCDIAPCGLGDGMRWAFLSTEQGLIFCRDAYPGAQDALDLDDIEAYILKQLS